MVNRGGRERHFSVAAASFPAAGARQPILALLPDYSVPGISGMLSTSVAGGIGTIAVFLISFVVGRAFTRPGRLEAAFSRTASTAGDASRSG
jgi:hypothetical protein